MIKISDISCDLDAIFQFLGLHSDDIKELQNDIIINLNDSNYIPSQTQWEMVNSCCDAIRENSIKAYTSFQKIDLMFELLYLWPTYTVSANIFRMYCYDKCIEGDAELHLWKCLINSLVGTDVAVERAVSYVIWVDFFEDHTTCETAFTGMVDAAKKDPKTIDALLIIAGPVPFLLKSPLYQVLVHDTRRHEVLAESLAHSAADFYGQFDAVSAAKYINVLNQTLSSDNKFLVHLNQVMESVNKPKFFQWNI